MRLFLVAALGTEFVRRGIPETSRKPRSRGKRRLGGGALSSSSGPEDLLCDSRQTYLSDGRVKIDSNLTNQEFTNA